MKTLHKRIKKTERINFRVEPETHLKIKMLSEEMQTTQTDIVETAVDLLFQMTELVVQTAKDGKIK